jgi:hypothetical protein
MLAKVRRIKSANFVFDGATFAERKKKTTVVSHGNQWNVLRTSWRHNQAFDYANLFSFEFAVASFKILKLPRLGPENNLVKDSKYGLADRELSVKLNPSKQNLKI